MSRMTLAEAAAEVDVIESAGRIIANPARHAPAASNAEVLAMAHAVECFWAIVLDAEILARAVRRPWLSGDDADDDANDHLIVKQAAIITQTLAAMRGDPETDKEKSDDDDR